MTGLDLLPLTVDRAAFTPWSALAGGALIGLAAGMLVLLNGRIAGIAGITGGLIRPRRGDIVWRLTFLLGLVAAPTLWQTSLALPPLHIEAGMPLLIVAGLLVGISTRYGAGCTSGHGVCGLARLSPRSLLATLCFMGAGFATVFIIRHLLSGG